MPHIGVKNRTDRAVELVHDGRHIPFNPGQVRIVDDVPVDFVESRMFVSHKTKVDPKTGEEVRSEHLQGLRLFDIMSIDDALKAGARPDEDPKIRAARIVAEEKRKERAALLADMKEELMKDGWVPPSEPKNKGGR